MKEQQTAYAQQAKAWADTQSNEELIRQIIAQEKHETEIMTEAENRALVHKTWAEVLRGELLRRMNETETKTIALDVGKATRRTTTSYSIENPDDLLDLIKETESLTMFNTTLNKKGVEELIAQNDGKIPDGIGCFTKHSLIVTSSK